jgi:hypothetical protein
MILDTLLDANNLVKRVRRGEVLKLGPHELLYLQEGDLSLRKQLVAILLRSPDAPPDHIYIRRAKPLSQRDRRSFYEWQPASPKIETHAVDVHTFALMLRKAMEDYAATLNEASTHD